MDAEKILKRDENLLKWESYLRRTRTVACGLAVVGLLGLAYWLVFERHGGSLNTPELWQLVVILVLEVRIANDLHQLASKKSERSPKLVIAFATCAGGVDLQYIVACGLADIRQPVAAQLLRHNQ